MNEGILLNIGAVIIRKNKFVLVQEKEAPFTGKWNFPLGKLEPNEKIPDAVVREVQEETGLDVDLTGFLGIYQNIPNETVNVVICMFVAEAEAGELVHDDKEHLQAKWFTKEEFAELKDEELFHPEMRRVVERAFTNLYPLDLYTYF